MSDLKSVGIKCEKLKMGFANIASIDHLTENVHNVLGQIWQATRQNPKYNK